MKLPDVFNQFLRKSPVRQEAYLSLVLEAGMVQSAVWTIEKGRKTRVSESAIERVADNSWEKRLEACDRAIARLADREGRDDFEKVVLGLPAYYLDRDDNIERTIGTHIKKLTQELELIPIGFVPIHQAIVNMIKQDEGVQPSVILLEVGPEKTTLILYKVGVIVGRALIPNDDFVPGVEQALKGFKDLEVLPSRMLLYGSAQDTLENYKRDLLKHPWPTRANFIHYPKIEILPLLSLAGAVSMAGASELATSDAGGEGEARERPATHGIQERPITPEITTELDQTIEDVVAAKDDQHKEEAKDETDNVEDQEVIEDDVLDQSASEYKRDEDSPNDEKSDAPDTVIEADDNLVEVAPETLGFRQNVDILESPDEEKKVIHEIAGVVEPEKNEGGGEIRETMSRFISGIRLPPAPSIKLPKSGFLIFLLLAFVVVGVGWITYWVLPATNVTILEIPKTLTESSAVTVNPTATVVDAVTKTVPGRKQEKTVSGDKKITATGQKDIGDPARGTVTIYNKSLSGKQLKKGTVLVAGNFSFTLDTDVSIASASVSIDYSTTPGKSNAAITAVKLGPQSNLPASTEFSLKDTSTSVMVARNDIALAGGSSKVVTVVSRADFDTLITDLTRELIAKAKAELGNGVTGGERLIDETIKTSVTNKKFNAELDQEIQELAGTITVTISGISFRDQDIALLFADLVAANVPSGYTLRSSGETIHAKNIKIQKDGTIAVLIEYQGQALPVFDLPAIKAKLAGKTIPQAQEILKGISGVGGVEIGTVTKSLWGQKLPAKSGNIAISVAVLE
ncbi:MAG: hypothetical protein Q8L37_06420 [Candidatus Gottesmanbacteria bacterium]|nr:hypothetical protein [Candidatus Gottesmanbacteria bacterium]